LARADLADDANIVIVAVSLAVGLIPVAAPGFYDVAPSGARIILDSGISTGCVTAVVLNLLFHHAGRRRAGTDAASAEK
jgi:xanthine/uracil permease